MRDPPARGHQRRPDPADDHRLRPGPPRAAGPADLERAADPLRRLPARTTASSSATPATPASPTCVRAAGLAGRARHRLRRAAAGRSEARRPAAAVRAARPTRSWRCRCAIPTYAVVRRAGAALARRAGDRRTCAWRSAGSATRRAPFNGWYMGTEIGARNLADADRYDLLPGDRRTARPGHRQRPHPVAGPGPGRAQPARCCTPSTRPG